MNKSKLFAICLTVALMASGCANTNTNSQADSQENESSVESVASEVSTSEVSDTSEESPASETGKAEESKEDKPIVEKEKSVSQQKETMVIEPSVEPLAVSRETAETSEIYIEESIEQSSEEPVILESSVETSVVSEEIIENDDRIWHIIPASEFEDSDFEDSEDAEETEAESEEEYPEIWGIVKEQCVTHEGYEIGKNVYVKIVFNDLDDDYCIIQWYDDTAELDECYVDMFEIWKADTIPLIENGKTAGIITN